MQKTKAVQVKLCGYCDNYDIKYIRSDFSNINGTGEKKNGGVKYICGAGEIVSNRDPVSSLLPGRKVAFCGFIDDCCGIEIEVPESCIVPMDDNTPYKNAVLAGLLLPIVAALNATNLSLGEKIMAVCEDRYSDVTDKLIRSAGCTPIIVNRDDLTESEGFINKIMQYTSNQRMDAIIFLFHEDESITHLIPKKICPNRSRIVFADGIGIGYNDMDFMCSNKPYPSGYTGKTPKDNLELSLKLLANSQELAQECDDILENAIFLKSDMHIHNNLDEIYDCNLTNDQIKLKELIDKRRSSCIFQMTVCKENISDDTLDLHEKIAVKIIESAIASKHDVFSTGSASRTMTLHDGSVVVINCIKTHKENTKIELHWDGKTAISENRIVKTYV